MLESIRPTGIWSNDYLKMKWRFAQQKNVITRKLGGRELVIDLVFASLDVSASIEYNGNSKNPLEVVASDHKLRQWKFYLNNNECNLGFISTLKKYNTNKVLEFQMCHQF
jgi:hypothetical protein